jgi:hypothetical protein
MQSVTLWDRQQPGYLKKAAPIFKAVSGTFMDAFNQVIKLWPAFSGSFVNAFADNVEFRAALSDPASSEVMAILSRIFNGFGSYLTNS